MTQTIGLFPTPFMRFERLMGQSLASALIGEFAGAASLPNTQSELLSHSRILAPGASPAHIEAGRLIAPKLVESGALMFGESLVWSIKEMWVNILQTGGRQSIHNHANSFISGALYLSQGRPDARQVDSGAELRPIPATTRANHDRLAGTAMVDDHACARLAPPFQHECGLRLCHGRVPVQAVKRVGRQRDGNGPVA